MLAVWAAAGSGEAEHDEEPVRLGAASAHGHREADPEQVGLLAAGQQQQCSQPATGCGPLPPADGTHCNMTAVDVCTTLVIL